MTGQTPPPTALTSGSPNSAGKRALVVYNSKSGSGENTVLRCAEHLRAAGWHTELRELVKGVAMSQHVRDVEHFDAVIAAGGDGTVSSVAYEVRYRNVPLLAYPAGTANLIALNLGMPDDPQALAELVIRGSAVRVDLGELEVGGVCCGFAMLAGAGADAQMIRESEDLKPRFGTLAYIISALKQVSPRRTTFTLTVDGEQRVVEGIGVMVANFGKANYGLPINTDISPFDGHFTVIVLKAGNLLQLLPNLIASVRSKLNLGDPVFGGNGSLETFEAREILVEASDPFPLQYDGELHEQTTPFTARILPGAVRFLTPQTQAQLTT